MDFGNEAGEIRVLKRLIERGFVYRGLKPVLLVLRLRLVAGRVRDRVRRPQVDRRSTSASSPPIRASWPRPSASPSLAKDAFAVIWTTTPWTLPANQALNLNPQLEYSLVDTERGLLRAGERAGREVPGALRARGPGASPPRRARSSRASSFRHPLAAVDPGYDRVAPVYLADYATAEDGTGIVHSSPGLRHRGLQLLPRPRPGGRRRSSTRCRATASTSDALPLFGGEHIWKANPQIVEALRDAGRLLRQHDARAQLSALLAPQDAGDLPRRGAVVRAHGRARRLDAPASSPSTRRRRPCARSALDAIDATAFYPENGRARLHDMIAHRPDWCISRQRNWGVPLPLFLHKVTGELHPDTLALIDRAAAIVEQGGVEAWSRLSAEDVLGADGERSAALRQEQRHPRRLVRFRLDLLPRPARQPSGHDGARRRRQAAPRPTSTSKATTSTAAGSTRRS